MPISMTGLGPRALQSRQLSAIIDKARRTLRPQDRARPSAQCAALSDMLPLVRRSS